MSQTTQITNNSRFSLLPNLQQINLNPVILLCFMGFAMLAYLLPAVNNPGAGLTLNSFDLAEWASLHPAASANNLQTSLFLRLQPVFIGTILALNTNPRNRSLRWSGLLLLFLIAVAQLPPLEFLSETGNSNYQQQLSISGITIVITALVFSGYPFRLRNLLTPALLLLAAATYALAISQALTYMQQYSLPTQAGIGTTLLLILYGLTFLYVLSQRFKANRTAR